MAKQKKKRNKKYKKYRQNYVTGDRVDMRNGGRVGYQTGDIVKGSPIQKAFRKAQLLKEEDEMSIQRENTVQPSTSPNVTEKNVRTVDPKDRPNYTDNRTLTKMPEQNNPRDEMIFADNMQSAAMGIDGIMGGNSRRSGNQRNGGGNQRNGGGDQQGGGNQQGGGGNQQGGGGNQQGGGGNQQTPTDEFTGMTDKQIQDLFESERGQRVIETGRTAQDIAEGKLPDLPEAEVEKVSQEGTTASTIQMDATTPAEASTIAQTAPEQVAQADTTTAQTPEQIRASQMEAATVDTQAQVDAAQGQVSDQSIAQAAKVDRVAPIEGAEVEIPEGALTDRVVGSISEGAKAIAAQNAGTSLSRITRAKKQLSKAGLSDSDIQEIGNDPEALEDRLADFSEQERGIIAGLPEEALVSTQLNGLLEGMENGEIPPWAKPAVTQVEQMLAARGLSASSVGRDGLFNAIIQSALPIAQSNAQAIQQSVSQQRNIEAQEAEANAQRMQQTALTNANNVFQMDMAQFSSDQQIALSNSKFLQTVGLTEASNEQQSTIQNAALMSQANLTEADFNQRSQIQNAQAFLQMDMANLTNQQQSNVLKAQQEQQRILSNQSATNAARQFNSASENQTNQFMATLEANINQFNTAQMNANSQFNAQSINAAAARDANRVADVNKANAAILNQVSQFNAQLDFNREQWNSANEQAIVNSNINWRRQSNLADTAAQNAVNQQNAQNAFNLTSSALSFLWQELRDQADYDFKWATDTANRKLNAMIAAASSEGDAAKNWSTNFDKASNTVDRIFGET
jgi:hypothetical protein